jgi:iron complex transport system ATP-binding protein
MIARVLAQEPEVILLDEPLSHLDLSNQARLLLLMKDLVVTGLTVVAVLHDPNTAFLYGDDFLFMKDGLIKVVEKSNNPWDASTLTDVYDTPIEAIPFRGRSLVIPI